MTTKITRSMLERHGIKDAALAAFDAEFPQGMPLPDDPGEDGVVAAMIMRVCYPATFPLSDGARLRFCRATDGAWASLLAVQAADRTTDDDRAAAFRAYDVACAPAFVRALREDFAAKAGMFKGNP